MRHLRSASRSIRASSPSHFVHMHSMRPISASGKITGVCRSHQPTNVTGIRLTGIWCAGAGSTWESMYAFRSRPVSSMPSNSVPIRHLPWLWAATIRLEIVRFKFTAPSRTRWFRSNKKKTLVSVSAAVKKRCELWTFALYNKIFVDCEVKIV